MSHSAQKLLHFQSNLVQIFECFPQTWGLFDASLSHRCKSILTSASSMMGLQNWVKRGYLHNLHRVYDQTDPCSTRSILKHTQNKQKNPGPFVLTLLIKMSLMYFRDLLPVLLTGAGPLSAVDHLGHPCHQACGRVNQAGVELVAAGHHPAAVRCVPGVIAVGPWQQVCHGHEKVVESNANDHIVIDPNVGGHHHHAIAHTCREKKTRWRKNRRRTLEPESKWQPCIWWVTIMHPCDRSTKLLCVLDSEPLPWVTS